MQLTTYARLSAQKFRLHRSEFVLGLPEKREEKEEAIVGFFSRSDLLPLILPRTGATCTTTNPCARAYPMLFLAIAKVATNFDMELFETKQQDIELYHTSAFAIPVEGSSAVKVRVTEWHGDGEELLR